MEIAIQAPSTARQDIAAYLAEHNVDFECFEKKGLNGHQIVDFVLTYGPSTLAIINGLLTLYINAKKIKKIALEV